MYCVASVLTAAAAVAVILAGCGTKETASPPAPSTSSSAATTTPTAVPAGEKVGAADLPAIVSDRTYRGSDDGEPYSEYYAADGTLRGTSGGEAYAGSWEVVGEQLCFTYPETSSGDGVVPSEGAGTTECYTVFKNGDALTWVTPDGQIVEATYVDGNPDNL